jgi:glycosyltransferase involved in cell wall biosynthesis
MTTEHPTPPIWCIMPVLGARDYTVTAIADLLAQTLPVKILVVNQGVDDDFRDELERIAEAHPERVFVWHHVPPLPSLAATWNRALDFVWAVGGEVALVVNNDVRVPRQLVEILAAISRAT